MRGDTRGQSELIGVVLLTGVIITLTVTVGAVLYDNTGSAADADPLVNIDGNATSKYITVTHAGGDTLDVSDTVVILRGEGTERYRLENFTQIQGEDTTTFEAGDKWRGVHGLTGDEIEAVVVDEESNSIVDSVTIDVVVTIAARFDTSPRYPREDETITFDASESEVGGSTLTSYEWEFGDGDTDSGETVDKSYSEDGSYDVTLTVEAADGRTANRTKTVRVYNEPPNPEFSYTPDSPDPGETVSFDATNSTDPDGSISSYDWNFGDGNTGTSEMTTHTYSSDGTYSVALTVTDNDGDTAKRIRHVTVGEVGGFSSASVTGLIPSTTQQNQSVRFSPSGSPIKDGTRLTFNFTEPQQTSPRLVDYQGSFGTTFPTSNKNTPIQNTEGYEFSATVGEEVGTNETVRVWVNSIKTGLASQQTDPYDVTITRRDTGGSITPTFNVSGSSGDAQLSNLAMSDLREDETGQDQTVEFTLDSQLPRSDSLLISLYDPQSSGEVDYEANAEITDSSIPGEFETATFSTANANNVTIKIQNTSQPIPAGTYGLNLSGVNTGQMDSTPYQVNFSRGDADTASTTFGLDDTPPSVTVEQPNGGETIEGGNDYEIQWTATDRETSVGLYSIDLAYSADNGTSWNTIATGESDDGSYTWSVPSTVDTTDALVRVTADDSEGNTANDTSDGTFTIDSSPPSIDTFTDLSTTKNTYSITIGSLTINDSASGLTAVDIVVRDSSGTVIGSNNSTSLGGVSAFSATDLEVSTDSKIKNNEQYNVTVVATDSVAKEASASETTTTSGTVADANGPYTVDEDKSITLDGSGSSPSNPKSYDWTITNSPGGDSISEDTSTPNATYNAPTNVDSDTDITVELAVEDGGKTYTDTATVTVRNVSQNSGADPTVDSLSLSEKGNEISADWSVSDPDGDLSSVSADFISQDSTDTGSDTSAVSGSSASGTSTHKGNNKETYDVTITVEDSNGNTDTWTKTITL